MSRPVRPRRPKSEPDTRQMAFAFMEPEGEADAHPTVTAANDDDPDAPQPPREAGSKVRHRKPAASPAKAWDSPPVTLEEVRDRLAQCGLSKFKLRDLKSGVKRVADLIGRPPGEIPTDPAALRRLTGDVLPTAHGVTKRQWQAQTSRMTTALILTGADVAPGRATSTLEAPWRDLVDSLPSKRLQAGLSRLIHFLARTVLDPHQVSPEDFDRFHAELERRALKPDFERVYRNSLCLWNEAADEVPGWPQVKAVIPADRRRYALKLEEFPESFQQDVIAFLQRGSDPNPFSDSYGDKLKPRTVEKHRQGILQVASALIFSGFPIDGLTELSVLVEPDNAKAALSELHAERGGNKEYLAWQAHLIVTIAKYWLKDGAETVKALKGLPRRLYKPDPGMRPKNKDRLRQFELPANLQALLKLPARVLAEAERVEKPTAREARRVLLALAVELLTVTALRMKNLTDLRLGHSVVKLQRGREERWHIIIRPEESKNRQPLEFPIPSRSVALLETYLAKYRPLIGAKGTDFLFVTPRHEKRSPISLGVSIKKFIANEVGLVMHPHLFRHLAAKLILDANPQDVETARRLLGHATSATTIKVYAELQSAAAYRRWDAVLNEVRSPTTEPPAPRQGRKPRGAQ